MKNSPLLLLTFLILISSCSFLENKKSKNGFECEEMVCDTIDAYKMFLSTQKDTLVFSFQKFVIPDAIIKKANNEEVLLWFEFWQCWDCEGFEIVNFTDENSDVLTKTKVFYKGNSGYSSPINIQDLKLDNNKEISLVLTGKKYITIYKSK